MNKLLYLSDDEVQSQLAAKYDLLVYIGHENLQYAIIDSNQKEIKTLAEFEVPAFSRTSELVRSIENLPESNRQFRFAFNKVKIAVTTFNYTFIPFSLYDEADQPQYGKYINLTDDKELLVEPIFSQEIKNVIAIDSELKTALQRIFHNPFIYSQTNSFLEGAQKSLQRDSDSIIFIDVQPKHFQVALFRDFKLEFYNTFEYLNTDEFNYYLLNAIQSLEVSLEGTGVILSGKISKTDEVYQRLEKYFENIRFADTDYLNEFSHKFENVQPHSFFTLFSLNLCE